MPFIEVFVTYPNKKEAEKSAKFLLDKRIVACANIFPTDSIYRWKGNLEKHGEFVSVFKTTEQNWENLVEAVKQMHFYEVPAIIKHKVKANKDYEDWVKRETKIKN